MSGLAGLLSGIEPAPAADEPAAGPQVAELIGRRAAAERRRTRWRVAGAVAAGIVLLAAGIAVGGAIISSPASTSPPVIAITGQRHSAVDPVTGVAAEVGLVGKAWGTQVTMDLSWVRGPLECELVAVSRSGERRVIAGWLVPAAGYGVPGHPAHLLLEGGTSIHMKDLTRVIVEVLGGRTLVSIPV